MTYGKNQQALLKFLEKHPYRRHRIKRRKAIEAAKGLMNRDIGVELYWGYLPGEFHVRYDPTQMLRRQA